LQQWWGFLYPSTQRYYRRLILLLILLYCYMFRSYDHHRVENILLARITQLTTDPASTVCYENSFIFLLIYDILPRLCSLLWIVSGVREACRGLHVLCHNLRTRSCRFECKEPYKAEPCFDALWSTPLRVLWRTGILYQHFHLTGSQKSRWRMSNQIVYKMQIILQLQPCSVLWNLLQNQYISLILFNDGS
jgi:hypothetical protein